MFSQRTRWDLTANPLAEALARARAEGRRLLDLTESNPTAAGLQAGRGVLELLGDPAAARYAPDPRGLASAREAVARDFARRGAALPPERLLLTASTSEAYGWLFKLLCDPGDAVLVPRPSYPLFEYLAGLESVRVDRCELAYDGEWHLDRASLEAALHPRSRAVVVVHPNNPTGSYLKRPELDWLLELCARRGLALISDEVFADFTLDLPAPPLASLAADDAPALVFALGGLSKSLGLPQLKLGWIGVAGPAAPRAAALERLEVLGDTYLSVGTPVQAAAPALLARLPELQAPLAARVRDNLAALRAALAPGLPASLWRAEGGWYAVLRVPATLPEEQRCLRLLERHGVLVHPGYFFDFPGEAFLVLSLLPEPAVFAEGVARLVSELRAE